MVNLHSSLATVLEIEADFEPILGKLCSFRPVIQSDHFSTNFLTLTGFRQDFGLDTIHDLPHFCIGKAVVRDKCNLNKNRDANNGYRILNPNLREIFSH